MTHEWRSDWNQFIHGKDWSTGGSVTQQKFVWDSKNHKWISPPQDDIYVGDPIPLPGQKDCSWMTHIDWQKGLEENLAVAKIKDLVAELEKLEKAVSEKCCHCSRGGLTFNELLRLTELQKLLKGIKIVKDQFTATNNNC